MNRISKSIVDIVKQDFSRFDNLYNKLSDIFAININNISNKKLLLAVSWWPDSMLLSVLIYNFFVKNNLNLDNLFFVHCNHKTRFETDDEQKFVEELFEKQNLSVCVYGDGTLDCFLNSQWQRKRTEKNFRNWRYAEFQKIIDQNNIDFLLTGHNLTDRIESSFMNMFRGSGLNWFVSMKFLDQNNLLSWVQIVRPLLWYTKSEIEWFCEYYKIKFVVDPTNLDKTTSLRNDIRLSLFPQFAKMSNKNTDDTNSFLDSMRQIYLELDDLELSSDMWVFIKMLQSPYRNSDFAYMRDIPLWFITKSILLKVFKKFNVSSGIQTETLADYLDFFHSAKQWYKYINGVYFFMSHKRIYIIRAKQNFWKKYIEKSLIIDKLWNIKIWKASVIIDDNKLVWSELRYPKKWDKMWSKSWSKYCINQQIPVFWRNFMPVIVGVGWNNIIKYFK